MKKTEQEANDIPDYDPIKARSDYFKTRTIENQSNQQQSASSSLKLEPSSHNFTLNPQELRHSGTSERVTPLKQQTLSKSKNSLKPRFATDSADRIQKSDKEVGNA